MLGKAIALASEAFQDTTDKGGNPYILHCLHVMNTCGSDDQEVLIAAVLHDLLEDTSYTDDDLFQMGYNHRMLSVLNKLTHKAEDSYDDYIKIISTCPKATMIKLADLRHNSDILRMKGLRKKDFDRLEKYHRAFMYLSN